MSDEPTLDYESAPIPPADVPPPKGALGIIFLIVLMDLFGFGVIIPLLPFYAREYAASDFQVGLLFSVYSACQLLAAPVLGLMSDRYGRRPVLVISQLGSVAGYVLLGVATHKHWNSAFVGLGLVYLSRIIDGISGGNISTAQAYISDVTTKETRAKAMGLLGAAFGIGFALGPALGGILGGINVSYPAFAAALFSAIAAVQTFLRLPESRKHVHQEESEGWLHPAKFLPILKDGVLVQMLMLSFISMMAFVMMESVFALFLKDSHGYDVRHVGYFFAFVGLIIVIVQGGLIGRLVKRFGEWPLAIVGPVLVAAGMAVYVRAEWHLAVWLLLLAGTFNATGRSLQTPTMSSLISHRADPKRQGTVFGLYHSLGSFARVIGPMFATGIYSASRTWPPFATSGAIMLAVGLWTLALRATGANAANA